MIRSFCLTLFLCLACGVSVIAQNQLSKEVRRNVRHGNRMYHTGQRDQATVAYMKAFQADSTSSLVQYNLATSLFPNEWKLLSPGMRDTVVARLSSAAQAEPNPIRRSMSYHNIGVAMQSAGQLRQAIEAYKQCLRCNPADDEARYNMVLCQRQLKDGDGGNDQQDNQQQDDQQQQNDQQQDDQQQDDQQQNQDQPQDQPQQDQQQNQDWIEQMLNAADQHERQVRRRIDEQQNRPQRRRGNVKNW